MTLGELMPSFGKFYCKETCGIDGSALYANRVYPIAVYGYVWNIEKYSHNRKRASKGIK